MSFAVFLTDDAADDLSEIYEYIESNDSPARAEHVLRNIEKVMARLSQSPKHRAYPGELLALGVKDYREVFFKPYRIIYRLIDRKVYVLLIADGRRDMQTLLQRRLLSG